MKKSLTGVAAIAAAALALTGCSSGESGNASTGDVPLNIGNFLDLTSWDPALADIGFDGPYLSAVYDPLVVVVDDEGEAQPALATGWEVSDDFLTVTMDIRTDAVFSNGEPVDVEAVVKSLEYLKEGVRSQEAYQKVDDFEVIDEDTFAINLTERDDTMLYFMGLGRSYVMAPSAIDDGSLAETPVGSGPYTLGDATTPGSEYHFDKVQDHWAADEFRFDPLVVSPVSDPTAMLNGLEGGQFNVIYGDETAIDMAEDQDWNVSAGVATWNGLQFTDRAGDDLEPLGDKRVRQALNYAFDGQSLLDAVRDGAGAVTNQVFPDGTAGNLPELNDMYSPDMEKAKELMAEAGYADGFDVTMPMAPPFQDWQASIEQTLGELDIDVSWEEYQFADYTNQAPTYPMFIAVLAMDGNPVATVERQIADPQWYNPEPGLDDFPEIQAQVDEAFSAEPGDEQIAAIEELNEMLTEEAWFSVWLQSNNSYISTSELEVESIVGMMFPTLRHISVVE